ncbi:DUF4232 domain-containing protein [Actinoplanes oblitus]|uniref:DUF4232 domain-containing protein n=1 Tax=Actinoplanes oblitus TaxID=3040509 RepID=A0ABY8WHQ7_9ACTN|nr:DUF4232 domain-containing protein [Actinoplanes oblitus]WIM97360.1 DUF4232 domain-containing protein [Actinoplanes oblitus]
MRDLRTRVLRAAAPALLLLGTTAGCSGATGPATGQPTAAAPATTKATPAKAAPTGTASTKAAATTAATTAVTGGKCRDADLRTTITRQTEGTASPAYGMVTLTNGGKHSCTVDGWISVAPVNAANEVIEVPTRKVEMPGPAETLTVKPGTSVFVGLKWVPCPTGDDNCGWGNSLRYSVRGPATGGPFATLEEFGDPERNEIRMKSLQIGTYQPTVHTIVGW